MISKHDLEKLVDAFLSGRLDCCNGLFACLSNTVTKQLQLIQNAAARLVYQEPKKLSICHSSLFTTLATSFTQNQRFSVTVEV